MSSAERPSQPLANCPELESTETDGPAGRPPDAATVAGTGELAADATRVTTGPSLDATSPPGPIATTAHAVRSPDRDATVADRADATEGFTASPAPGGRADGELPRIAGHEILGVLGAGGMGIVYKAHQTRLDRLVALKMILAGAGARPGDLARFEAEARAVAAIDHPNIIKIFEIGEHDGLPYFSLEYLAGGSLADRIGGKPQPVDDAARIVETLVRALAVAHARGIVHRDIKPANVLLAADGTPKIADFGLVKRLEADSAQTRTGSILGSPSYMAPEQTTGAEKAGPAADQYALGATLYEMLTGRPPFRGTSILDTLDLIRTREPVPPSQLLPRMPRDLETICLKALQKDPARRYPDLAAMAEDLRRFRAGEPIVARPVSGPERLWRWCRRNPGVASLAATVALLLGVVAVGATAAYLVAEGRRIEAVAARRRAEAAQRRAEAAGRAAIQQNRDVVEAQREMILLLEDKWRNVPALGVVRKDVLGLSTRILESAAGAMTTLRSEIGWPEADEELNWRSVGLAHQRIGEVRLAENKIAEAEKEFRLNHEITKRLAAAAPDDLARQARLLKSHRQLGYFAQHQMGDSREALRHYQQSLEIARACVAKAPDGDKYKDDLASTLFMMAITESQLGHLERARALLDEDRTVRESCSAAWKGRPGARLDLAVLYDQLFDVSLRQGDPAAARRYNERCAELCEAILAGEPQFWSAVYNLARSYNNSGMLLYPMGRDPAGARAYHRKALELLSRRVAADPTNAPALQRLATTLYYEATCARHAGDRAGAAAGYRRCLEIREKLATDPKAKIPRIELMLAQARCGQHERAAAIARELAAQSPDNEMIGFQAACGFALSAGAVRDRQSPALMAAVGAPPAAADALLIRDYVDRAIDCLRRAKARGFSDVVGLETDPDLEPIRDDPAFRTLLDEFPRPAARRP